MSSPSFTDSELPIHQSIHVNSAEICPTSFCSTEHLIADNMRCRVDARIKLSCPSTASISPAESHGILSLNAAHAITVAMDNALYSSYTDEILSIQSLNVAACALPPSANNSMHEEAPILLLNNKSKVILQSTLFWFNVRFK